MSKIIKANLNRFWWETKFRIDTEDLWKYLRRNNSVNKTALLMLEILNIKQDLKHELIKEYEKNHTLI